MDLDRRRPTTRERGHVLHHHRLGRLIYALVAGLIWWIDLARREAFNFIEAFAISASAIGVPILGALIVLGFGYGLRVFALYVSSKVG